MKFFAVNGSKRNEGNTALLLKEALKGVKNTIPEAETEYINLFDIPFNGCKSCFACKKINGRHYGRCVYKDDFKPILQEITQADGVILGSPIYFGDLSGNMRCFLERFIFPFFVYDNEGTSLAPKRMPLGFIYTMNVTENIAKEMGYFNLFDLNENFLESIFTKPYRLCSFDTYQFNDYSKYKNEVFSQEHKAKVRQEQFPIDLKKSYGMGVQIAKDALK